MKAISMFVNGHTLQNRNPGTGGGGIVLNYGGNTKELSVPVGMTTNNKAELTTPHTVTFEWIKKGSHELLNRASALANEAANESAMGLKKTS